MEKYGNNPKLLKKKIRQQFNKYGKKLKKVQKKQMKRLKKMLKKRIHKIKKAFRKLIHKQALKGMKILGKVFPGATGVVKERMEKALEKAIGKFKSDKKGLAKWMVNYVKKAKLKKMVRYEKKAYGKIINSFFPHASEKLKERFDKDIEQAAKQFGINQKGMGKFLVK